MLRARFQALSDAEPGLRIRTMAKRLGVAELELLCSGCGDLSARPLAVSPQALLRALPAINEVMAVTRNPWCVHECTGRYEGVRAERQVGLVTGDTIDLRIYFNHWHSIWAVSQPDRRSIQVFDRSGTAVHKVYATPQTHMPDFEALIERHLGPDRDEDLVLQPYPPTAPLEPPADPAGLRAGWP
ncbi:Hemin transport protein HmuS [Orrella dioscoreae]|uniref:Hemin transport protein HmuS n=2 Tax=Orrella dioscoreae TaxID=1851544 RepID=A0A1C3K3Z6_9BURK|nr:Hemin transport protein HmuS [Orrella dioscoreae]SOE51276.1 Hemin transport protein HmuS [Orrella dioscoreae]